MTRYETETALAVRVREPRWRPIPFQGWSVRAIYADLKTQTRRLVKWPAWTGFCEPPESAIQIDGPVIKVTDRDGVHELPCPFGVIGDRLWVRETWQAWQCVSHERDEWDPITREVRLTSWAEYVDQRGRPDTIEYRATSDSAGPWTPAMFMPRWASRLSLEIIDVRVERLQSITAEDARAEGVAPYSKSAWDPYRLGFAHAWDRMHGKSPTAAWASNTLVWVITFRRLASETSP